MGCPVPLDKYLPLKKVRLVADVFCDSSIVLRLLHSIVSDEQELAQFAEKAYGRDIGVALVIQYIPYIINASTLQPHSVLR